MTETVDSPPQFPGVPAQPLASNPTDATLFTRLAVGSLVTGATMLAPRRLLDGQSASPAHPNR